MWQNLVAGSRGIQAGGVSKAEGDPGEGSLGCASVLCRCPIAHSGGSGLQLSVASTSQRSQQQPLRICRQNLQAGPRYPSLPQCGASCQGSAALCTRASACCLQSAAFVQLQKQYLAKRTVREIWFYLALNLMKTLTNMGFCSVIWTPSPEWRCCEWSSCDTWAVSFAVTALGTVTPCRPLRVAVPLWGVAGDCSGAHICAGVRGCRHSSSQWWTHTPQHQPWFICHLIHS